MVFHYPRLQLGLSELTTVRLRRTVLAEFLSLLLFVYIGCGAVVASLWLEAGQLTAAALVAIALAHGLAIAVLVASTSAISGGHVNPAVTLAMMATGKISIVRGVMYIIGQLVGAIAGSGLLYATVPKTMRFSLGAHTLNPLMEPWQAFIMEAILTFTLVFVIFANAVDSKGHGTIAPLAIGLSVAIDHLIGVPFTGASMNPARSFGPAVVMDIWSDHWVYWVGPCVGALVAGVLYQVGFLAPTAKHGPQGGGIDEVTPGVLLNEIRGLRRVLGGNMPVAPAVGDINTSERSQLTVPLGHYLAEQTGD